MPNCYVSLRHAVTGGIIAAILFELAKKGFEIYAKSAPSTEAIYGAITTIPIFLIWIYLSWIIVILGAHITFCISSFRLSSERRHRMEPDLASV